MKYSELMKYVSFRFVFQLSSIDQEDDDPRAINMASRGRTLAKRGRTYDAFMRDVYRGWVFAKTTLSEEYTMDDLLRDRPKSDLIAEIRPDGTLIFLGPSREVKGGPGAIVISFGPDISPEKEKAKNTDGETTEA